MRSSGQKKASNLFLMNPKTGDYYLGLLTHTRCHSFLRSKFSFPKSTAMEIKSGAVFIILNWEKDFNNNHIFHFCQKMSEMI